MAGAAPLRQNRGDMKLLLAAALILTLRPAPAATLTPSASAAFDAYIAEVEARLAVQHSRPETYVSNSTPAPGTVRIEAIHGGTWKAGGALLHHWRAAARVEGVRAEDLLDLLRDYDHLARYYAPDVVSSHALARDGDRVRLAMRFKKKQVITVVLDAEFDTRTALSVPGRGYSVSRSTSIRQVEHAGTARERALPVGDDDGLLWRLNSYWSFIETPSGLLMELEAVSLTRDVPTGLGWIVMPIIRDLPRKSLEFTFDATRKALAAIAARRQNHDRAN